MSRERRSTAGIHHVAGAEDGHQLLELRPVGGCAGQLVAEHFLAPGSLELGKLGR